jgi:hypothetical protein
MTRSNDRDDTHVLSIIEAGKNLTAIIEEWIAVVDFCDLADPDCECAPQLLQETDRAISDWSIAVLDYRNQQRKKTGDVSK